MRGIDIIGPMYAPPARPEGWVPGDPADPPVRLWGWHVNITIECLAARPDLESKIHQPATLQRVWAGDDPADPALTVPLRFNGESAAREALGDLWPVDLA